MTTTDATAPRKAILHTDTWAGHVRQPVLVIAETAHRYRIKAPPGAEVKIGKARHKQILFGEGWALVPKYAVVFE